MPHHGDLDGEPTVVLRSGSATAEVALLGATVLRWVVDLGDGPADLLDGYRTAEELRQQDGMRNALMAPFCDRIADARYTFDGVEHDLRPGSTDRLVNHGFVSLRRFVVQDPADDPAAVTLTCSTADPPHPGYPFAVDVEVTLRLRPDALAVQVTAHNRGPTAAPFAAGWHPYLRLPGAAGIGGLHLEVPSAVRVETAPDLIPLPGEAAYAPVPDGVVRWQPIGDAVLDVGYLLGGGPTTLLDPATGVRVVLSQDRGLVHVYTGDTISRDRRASVAVEPVEAVTDAFNRPEWASRVRLEPGTSRTFGAALTVAAGTSA